MPSSGLVVVRVLLCIYLSLSVRVHWHGASLDRSRSVAALSSRSDSGALGRRGAWLREGVEGALGEQDQPGLESWSLALLWHMMAAVSRCQGEREGGSLRPQIQAWTGCGC